MIDIVISDKDFKRLAFILKFLDVDVSSLEKNHLKRRLRRRLLRTGHQSVSEYIEFAFEDLEEQKKLRQAFSVNFTRFFRNIKTFIFIKSDILPTLLKRNPQKPIRIWSAGCADGAEAYTLAILCNELKLRAHHVKIIASDFNQKSLDAAQKGKYPADYLFETPLEIQQEYFTFSSPEAIQVSPHLKKYITFSWNNLTHEKDSILDTKFDLILCRNVMIYFSASQKPKLIKKFHQQLKSRGLLVLGLAEVLPNSSYSDFSIYNTKHHVYMKK